MNQLAHSAYPAAAANLTAALQSPRAIDAQLWQLEYVLAQAMAKAFADMGIKTNDRQDEVSYLVQTMPAQVVHMLPGIRLEEIPLAINRGILQQFGSFYGLNVATFMHFLTAHYQSIQRAEAVKQHLAAIAAVQPAPTAAQLQQQRRSRILTAFEQYKAQGFYNDYGSLVFNSINQGGKIPFSAGREDAILEQARLNLMRRYSRGSVYPHEREKLKTNLDKLLQGNGASLILTEAKHIALVQLFDELIEQGLSIAELIP